MQVFKTFFKVSKKYWGAFFVYTVIFLFLISMFVSQKATDKETSFKVSTLKIAVFDHDNSELSKSLISYIESNHERKDIDEDIDSIRDNMYQRNIDYVLIIPDGFEENIISLKNTDDSENHYQLESYKLPGSTSGTFADSQINKFISVYSSYIIIGYDSSEANEKTIETLSAETEVEIQDTSTEEYPTVHIYYLYLSYIFISVITLCISPILAVFNKSEIRNRTAISCLSPLKRNLCLVFAALLYTFLLFCLFVGISFMMYPDDIFTEIGIIRILNAFVYAMVSLGFGFCLSSFVANQNLLAFITNFVGLAGSFLCGVFIDRNFLGKSVLTFGKIFPAHWYVNITDELLKYDSISQFSHSTNTTLMYSFVIQILFAIAFFVGGMVITKSKKSIG